MKLHPNDPIIVYTIQGQAVTETILWSEYERRRLYGGLYDWKGDPIPPELKAWAAPIVAEIPALAVVAAIYVNHRGEEAVRRIRPVSISPLVFRSSPFHLDRDGTARPRWIFEALDADRDDDIVRDFALTGVRAWVEASEYAR